MLQKDFPTGAKSSVSQATWIQELMIAFFTAEEFDHPELHQIQLNLG